MSRALEVLQNTRKLIESPKSWIQCVFACNADNISVSPMADDACKFCLAGALARVLLTRGGSPLELSARQFLHVTMGPCLVAFNDNLSRKHEEVIEAVDRAIQLAKETSDVDY